MIDLVDFLFKVFASIIIVPIFFIISYPIAAVLLILGSFSLNIFLLGKKL